MNRYMNKRHVTDMIRQSYDTVYCQVFLQPLLSHYLEKAVSYNPTFILVVLSCFICDASHLFTVISIGLLMKQTTKKRKKAIEKSRKHEGGNR